MYPIFRNLLLILIAWTAMWLVYRVVPTHDFVNWDDQEYVEHNPLVTQYGEHGAWPIFAELSVVGAYTPLSIWSLARDYQANELDAAQFHRTNLWLHGWNMLWVFVLVLSLTGRAWVAFAVALMWGLHPVNVESVAWVTARKDVLYAAFFLPALWGWWQFLQRREKRWYAFTLLAFVLSLLAKPMAVTLPMLLILLDYLHGQKIGFSAAWQKAPFFLLSLVMGVVNLFAQDAAGALHAADRTPLTEKLVVPAWGLLTYAYKSFWPMPLAGYHPYPNGYGEPMPSYFAWGFLFIAGLAVLLWICRKNRWVVFGIGFFVVSLLPILQVVGFGGAITAERFAYVALVAPMLLVALAWDRLREWGIGWWGLGCVVWVLVIGMEGWLTYRQAGTWRDGKALWTQVIKTYPLDYRAYTNRADWESRHGDQAATIGDYSVALAINPDYQEGWNNRGSAKFELGLHAEALEDFLKALELEPDNGMYLTNVGLAYMNLEEYDSAWTYFNSALEKGYSRFDCLFNLGVVYHNKGYYPEALETYAKAEAIDKENWMLLKNMAISFWAQENLVDAYCYFEKADSLHPGQLDIMDGMRYMKEKWESAMANDSAKSALRDEK